MDKDCITIDDYIKNGNKAYRKAMEITAKKQLDKVIHIANCTLLDQPFNSDKLLYDTMTDII